MKIEILYTDGTRKITEHNSALEADLYFRREGDHAVLYKILEDKKHADV